GDLRRAFGGQELHGGHTANEDPFPGKDVRLARLGRRQCQSAASSAAMSAPRMALRLRPILSTGQSHQLTLSRRSTVRLSKRILTALPGLPATTVKGATSWLTTDFAAMIAP